MAVSAIAGAKYVGTRNPICDPQGRRISMHVVQVDHPNGPWEAIYCNTEAQAKAIVDLVDENNKLRGLVAKGEGDCVYCQLPAADIAKCPSGFPGCARMDDIVNAQETEKDQQLTHLRLSLMNATMEVSSILDSIPHAIHVREGGGEENVFASLAVSVTNLMAEILQHEKKEGYLSDCLEDAVGQRNAALAREAELVRSEAEFMNQRDAALALAEQRRVEIERMVEALTEMLYKTGRKGNANMFLAVCKSENLIAEVAAKLIAAAHTTEGKETK